MSDDTTVSACLEHAAAAVAPVWPLHSFVTVNPLAGFEDRPFHEAVRAGRRLFGGDGYPSAAVFRRALETDRIDAEILAEELAAHGFDTDPERSLDRLADQPAMPDRVDRPDAEAAVDRAVTRWLAAFLDEGSADWPMPNRESGFYTAFRTVVSHDPAIPTPDDPLPEEPAAAIRRALSEQPRSEWEAIFRHQLTALPGWTGLIRRRADADGPWQSAAPISLTGYLAVRLTLTDLLGAPRTVAPPDPTPAGKRGGDSVERDETVPRREAWLRAWERTYRRTLAPAVADGNQPATEHRPDAQLVFCIDSRSEVIRRHVEREGAYETYGYAGFFGIPMRYESTDSPVAFDSCPPIVDATHRIEDRPTEPRYDRWSTRETAGKDLVKRLTSNAATVFSYVESAGLGYGAGLAARTLLPRRLFDAASAVRDRIPEPEPSVEHDPPTGIPLSDRVEYAATAFELLGMTEFARLVVFTGHASRTTNNPFEASLDCGACAGNPGGPNAQVLATICNQPAVRRRLQERGIQIPDDTVFLAGQHDTTTDEIRLFDEAVPESHTPDLASLRADLQAAGETAATERAGDGGRRETTRKAADWAETRPEWGLAGNAAFVIGPRSLTAGMNLDGRAFLHSYDPATDPSGDALAAIMNGPMVVTQWINTHYYFATVDPSVYGSGSKVTQNPVGTVGVHQGNGGSLFTGLPTQSIRRASDELHHQPLRLSVLIHAPVERVTEILREHDQLSQLADNNWLSLSVITPDHRVFHYDGGFEWRPHDRADPHADSPTTEPGE